MLMLNLVKKIDVKAAFMGGGPEAPVDNTILSQLTVGAILSLFFANCTKPFLYVINIFDIKQFFFLMISMSYYVS